MAISDVVQDALEGVAGSDVNDALQQCFINRHVNGTYDPIDNVETGGSDDQYSATIVLGGVPVSDSYKDLGVIIMSGDLESYVMKPEVAPVTTDKISVWTDNYDIVYAQESSAGAGEVYTIVLRLNNG